VNLQLLGNIGIGIVLIGFFTYRQMKWTPLIESRLWRMPIILGAIGVFSISQTVSAATLSSLDVSVLAIEIVVSVAVGAGMGAMARFRPLSVRKADGPRFETSTGWLGAGLWLVMIVSRVGIDIWATHAGSVLATSTGVILIMLGVNRAARAAMFAARLSRMAAVAA